MIGLALGAGRAAGQSDPLARVLDGMNGPWPILYEAARTGLVFNFTGGRDRHAVGGKVYDTIAALPGVQLGANAPRLSARGLRVDGPQDAIALTDLPALGFDPLQPFTLIVEWDLPALTGLQAALTIDDGTTSNRWPQIWAHNSGNAQVFTTSSAGSLQGVLSAPATSGRGSIWATLTSSSLTGSINNGAQTHYLAIHQPESLTRLRLGSRSAEGYLAGWFVSAAILPAPNSSLIQEWS